MKKNNQFVQFSKKVVIAVNIAVLALCFVAIILCWNGNDLVSLTNVVRTYIQFAMVVFASYSCNSVAQKLISHNQMDKIFSNNVTSNDKDEQENEETNG